ncbi:MAG: (Fe-S)-binding protein [bacterium]|nr:(Fe-S)-binding protein [bacterium]
MTKLKYLDKYKEDVSRCVRCGGCQATCPTYAYSGDESMVARGRMALVEAVIDKRLGLTGGFSKAIDSCLDCRACMKSCPSSVKVDEIIYAAKAEVKAAKGCSPFKDLVAGPLFIKLQGYPLIIRLAGLLKKILYDPLPNFTPLPSSMKLKGRKRLLPDIGGMPLKSWKKLTREIKNPAGRVAFYIGCATNIIHQHIGKAVIEVLEHNNIEVIIAKRESCCGIPFLSSGDRKRAATLAGKNIEAFTSLNVDAVVTCCATCGATLKDYPKWLAGQGAKDLSEKVMDIHYYLVHHTDYKKGMGEISRSVTWHDPCHLSRGQGIMDEPREILAAIPGLNFKEMKKPCYCCGFGGEASLHNYEMSIGVAAGKVEHIKDSGASELATGCPACKIHMEDALNHFSHNTPVRHAVEYLAESYRSGI